MKNKEFYSQQIVEFGINVVPFGVHINGTLESCSALSCKMCRLYDSTKKCTELRQVWANQEYTESPKLSKEDKCFVQSVKQKDRYVGVGRNADNKLFFFCGRTQPRKNIETCCFEYGYRDGSVFQLRDSLFEFIDWNKQPLWSLKELKELEEKI